MRCSFFSRIRSAAKTAVQTAVVSSVMVGAAQADIAINFQGDNYGNEFGRAVSQTAFGVAAGDWFADPTHTAGAGDGGTSAATIDGVAIDWAFNNDWAQSAAFETTGATGEDEAYFGYLDDGGSGADINITGLTAWLASEGATDYSVTLLMSTGQNGTASLKDTPLMVSEAGAGLGTFVVATEAAHSGGGIGLQGFSTISGLTSDTLFIDGQNRTGTARGSIAGVILQVTAVPEPSSLVVLGFGGLVLLRRRR